MNTIHDFLHSIFGDAPGHIVIWTAADKKSSSFENTGEGRADAAEYAASRANEADVYFGLGLHPKALPASSRGKADGVAGIGCVWADVDFGPGHKNPVAPDEATARRIVESVEPKPSMIVHSGGGLHCYWLLTEPWVFASDDDREKAKALVPAWQDRLRAAFAREGYTLDSTGDLARVLRLPGTFNHKQSEPRPVRLEHPDDGLNGSLARYSITDFEPPVAPAPAKTRPIAKPAEIAMPTREKRCLAYLRECPDAISGNGGHDATLRAACECYCFGLDDASALRVMQQFNQQKTGGETWTDKELAHKLESARKKVEQAGEIGCRLAEADDGLPVAVRWKGNGFRCVVTGGAVADTVDLGHADQRAAMVGKLVQAMSGIEPAEVEKHLLRLVNDRGRQLDANDERESDPRKTISKMLVEIAGAATLAHDENRVGYARFDVDGHEETYAVKSQGFRQWLGRRLYLEYGEAAYGDAMKAALDLIEAEANESGRQVRVGVRVIDHDGAIYLDLCDEKRRLVQITTSGWKVLDKYPVWFRRSPGMLALPAPCLGGSVHDLRPFLNVKTDADFVLVVAWLLAALNPHGPYPVLNVTGEQGSAKSMMQRLLRSLVDPNAAPLRSEPREERDLIIAANNSLVLAYDNLSTISGLFSDALCRIATEGGFAARALYTNDEEAIFNSKRPIMFNGISDLATRSDLLDRCITISLQPISPADRKDEKTLWAEFEKLRACILGALLDAVAAGLTHRDEVHIPPEQRPRMLDFALWVTACERGLPWKAGTFIEAYGGNRQDANVLALESSVVGQAVMQFMGGRDEWTGTCKELLGEFEGTVDERTRQRKDWPATPPKLRHAIERIAPNLRAEGLDVQRLPRTGHSRPILLRRIARDAEPVADTRQAHQVPPTGVDTEDRQS